MLKFIAGYFYHVYCLIKHRLWVFYYLSKFCFKLMWRAIIHDLSKFSHIESSEAAKVIFKLKNTTYGSREYKDMLIGMKPFLDHHYKHNSHHPEYHKNGFKDMTVIDKIEMAADWMSSVKRHKDGDIMISLKRNQTRFDYSELEKEYLLQIFKDMDKNID